MFKAIGGLFGKIFGSDKAIESGLGILERAGDAMFYTDEEKAQAAERIARRKDDLLVQWMESTKGQNLARRLLAVMITIVWLLMYIASFVVDVVSVWVSQETSALLDQTSMRVGEYASQMNGAMMLILAFYFAAPHMGKIVDGALSKFGGDKK